MNLSVVIPAHNEEEGVRPTVERLYGALMEAGIPCEILVVNDHSTDGTEQVLQQLAREMPGVRYVNNPKAGGFGRAIQTGLERFRGDAVCIVMADASDDPRDVVAYYHKLEEGYECVFGSRFVRGSRVVDYPAHKLLVNRLANAFINALFRLHFNDTTNAFKAYRREVIEGIKPFLSPHFNITVELPLKAITRGYTYATVPINWYNRATGVSKLKIKEMGSRYLFIVLYVWLEQLLSRGDYRRQVGSNAAKVNALDEHVDALSDETLPRHAVLAARAEASASSAPVATAPQRPAAPADQPSAQTSAPLGATTRNTSLARRSGPLAAVIAGLIGVVPVALIGYILLMIWTHTSHVPFWDEWETVTLMQHFTSGTLTWNDFWAFHNEHRIVIPQMLDLGLILVTHWNRQLEMTFDLALSVAEWALLVISAHRGLRSKALSILALAPMSLAIFSLTQFEDWLWSYQITFICTVLGVALCLWGLTSPRAKWPVFVVALIGAVVAALSSLGGLVVFVAFFPAVVGLGYKKTIAWLVVAAAVIVPYMRGFPHSVPINISLSTIEFWVTYLGAPAGIPSVKVSFAAGAVSLALAVANVLYYWVREKRITPLLPWIGLGAYAIGLALITSFGRGADAGLGVALTSRYQVFAVLWWVAVIYLLLLNLKGAWMQIARAESDSPSLTRVSPWIISANTLMLVIATLALTWANWQNVPNMEAYQYTQLQTESCVVNAYYAPASCLLRFYPSATILQQRADYLRAEHWTIFGENYESLEQAPPNPSMHALVRYFDSSDGDHWVTTSYDVNFYSPYAAEQPLGYLYDQQQPGTQALYTCVTASGHHFASLKVTCAGGTYLRTEGWLLDKPIDPTQDVALYDCASASGEFVSASATCEGQKSDGLLGYAAIQLPG
jgi:glycosyltransferase involved in cell wall biosynthesis